VSKITPCLWFDGQAEEAASYYVSLFPDSRIDSVNRAPADYPSGKAGDVLIVELTLAGRKFTALNGGPHFRFKEAVSFQIACEDQAAPGRPIKAPSGSTPKCRRTRSRRRRSPAAGPRRRRPSRRRRRG